MRKYIYLYQLRENKSCTKICTKNYTKNFKAKNCTQNSHKTVRKTAQRMTCYYIYDAVNTRDRMDLSLLQFVRFHLVAC